MQSMAGVDKITIYRKTMRKVVHTDDALDPENKSSLKSHSFTNVSGQEKDIPLLKIQESFREQGWTGSQF